MSDDGEFDGEDLTDKWLSSFIADWSLLCGPADKMRDDGEFDGAAPSELLSSFTEELYDDDDESDEEDNKTGGEEDPEWLPSLPRPLPKKIWKPQLSGTVPPISKEIGKSKSSDVGSSDDTAFSPRILTGAHSSEAVVSLLPVEHREDSKGMDMFNEEDHLALLFRQDQREKHESFVKELEDSRFSPSRLPDVSKAADTSSAGKVKTVDVAAVNAILAEHNAVIQAVPPDSEEAMTSDGKKACRGAAWLMQNKSTKELPSTLLFIGATFPTRNEVKFGHKVDSSGSTATMVNSLTYQSCVTAMAFMPLVESLIKENPNVAIVLVDACPSSTSKGSQQKVPRGAIIKQFLESAEKLVDDLLPHASGFYFFSPMAWRLFGKPKLDGVLNATQAVHPGQGLFGCASMTYKEGLLLEQLVTFFRFVLLAGVTITVEFFERVTGIMLEVMEAKNTTGRFWNVSSWLNALYQTHKLLFQLQPGGDP